MWMTPASLSFLSWMAKNGGLFSPKGREGPVQSFNVLAANGVIHVVDEDEVILP